MRVDESLCGYFSCVAEARWRAVENVCVNRNDRDACKTSTSKHTHTRRYFIILFPVLDLFSAFSINAIVLANNLLDVFPDEFITRVGFVRLKIATSVVVAALPIILAFAAHDLVTIINIAGTTGMLLMFFFPAMTQYFSIK